MQTHIDLNELPEVGCGDTEGQVHEVEPRIHEIENSHTLGRRILKKSVSNSLQSNLCHVRTCGQGCPKGES